MFVIYISVRLGHVSPLFIWGQKTDSLSYNLTLRGKQMAGRVIRVSIFVQILRVLRLNTTNGSTAILGRYLRSYLISVTFHPERVLLVKPK